MTRTLDTPLSREEKIAAVRRLARQRSRRRLRAPLSFAQRRMWFLDQLEPGHPFNNVCRAFRLRGRLDAAALAASLGDLVRRHGALRTRFPVIESEPAQVVEPPERTFSVPLADLSRLPAAARRGAAEKRLGEELRHGFDLARGGLFRAFVLRLADDDHVLVLNVHHIVFDGWSLGIVLREFAAGYGAFRGGGGRGLAAPSVHYVDYARWQAKHLRGERLEGLLAWWRQYLRGAPATLDLPTDRPRPAVESYSGAVVAWRLPAAVARRLGELARRSSATLFMTLLSAFGAVLWRCSGQRDMVIGTPVAQRGRPELEGIVGLFADTLVLRLELAGAATFEELLARGRRAALGAFAHQELPFELLVDALQPERDLSRNPLFQVMFGFYGAPPPDTGLPGLELERFETERVYSKIDLSLDVVESGDGLTLSFELNTDLFDRTTVLRLAQRLRRLLESVAADPGRPLAELPWLGAAERQALVTEWNDTRRPVPGPGLLHRIFEQQARRRAAAPALVADGRELSYGELDRLAGRLAARLQSLGVGTDVPVGVFTGRSREAVVALLGVLKAGGAYVPLDPETPRQRLAFFVADAGMPVVLTRGELGARLPAGTARIVTVDLGELAGAGATATSAGDPESTAYVIYTSGSTGVPKGVAVPHRAAVGHAAAIAERYRLAAGDRALQFTSPSFDVAMEEMFPTWAAGAAVVLRPHGLSLVLEDFLGFVKAERLSVLNLPTPFWHAWAAALPEAPEPPPELRLVVVGTEHALPERVVSWRRHLGSRVKWINSYGVTEATITSTAHGPSDDVDLQRVPVGRPVANVRAHVLDGAARPLPCGVGGLLHVGGGGVARGYLGRPRATAAAFVPDPFAAAAGARLYATGDLARVRADGELEFLGRGDDQVKIRGFRIELGEVEAALGELPEVRECAVLVHETPPSERRLVAYAVPASGATLRPGPLRGALAERLPGHMIPAAFVVLDELPRTAGGKVDRQALPAAELDHGLASEYVAPRDGHEELMAEIWAEVLGSGPVGVHDDFFALGGHSLLATQAVSRLRRALGRDVSLRSLFEAPTIAGLCERVAAAARPAGPPEPPLVRRRHAGEPPLSYAQERLWFLDQLEPGKPAYNLASPLALDGELDAACLAAALHALGSRHETLRTTIAERGGRPVQRIHPRPAFGLPLVDLTALPAPRRQETARRLAARESRQPFELGRGPLVRTALVRLGAREHVLLLTLHHIVADGWSIDVVMRELAELYRAAREGRAARLPALPLQYADFAAWQREWLQGEVLEAQLAHWRERLAGAPAALDLPTDRPRPAVPSYRGARRYFSMSAELTAGLEALGRRRGATLFMTLLAAFDVLLYRYSAQNDVVVGTPIAGRNRKEIEGLIGLFVNTLVLRSDLAGGPGFHLLLDRVRETSLAAYTHQDLPFEQLVEALQPERDLSRNPLFQVLFAWQSSARQQERSQPAMRLLSLDTGAAQLDLSLVMWRAPGSLGGFLGYATDLFDATTVSRAARHFCHLAAAIVADPERAVATLPLLGDAERQQMLREWQGAEVRYRPGRCLHELIEHQVTRTPEASALVFGDTTLSYRELNTRANQLAHHLRRLGVEREALVGVYLERSPELIVALLGILKAGGAYLPLDPEYPRQRLDFMLADGRAAVLLVRGDTYPEVGSGTRVVRLDTDWNEIARQEAADPAGLATPANLAYVIYTSGSTGRPKGVMNTHRGITNRLAWMQEAYRLDAEDRVLQKTPASFDVSVWEFFWPLLVGSTLVVAPPGAHRDGAWLARIIDAHRVTTLHFVPSMLQAFLAEPDTEEGCSSVRRVIASGEALAFQLKERFFERLGSELHNLYGPTEAAVDVTYHACEAGGARPVVPIGRPIANLRIRILDGLLLPVPAGVAGELMIGGIGLARGYSRRPALTARKFIPDPLATGGGERLYRTGDLARYLPDGAIEFLGRLDYQVKVRGLRIELGEIEAALAAHPGVAETVVTARGDGSGAGGHQLVAYLVPRAAEAPETDELRAFLRHSLPEYMIPAFFVPLAALPLTPNGKVDRKALPAPERRRREEVAFVSPRNPVEQQVAALWREILGVEEIGVHDRFFDLGGHSLLATQVMSRLRRDLGVDLPLRAIFDRPTVAGLAELAVEKGITSADHEQLTRLLAELEGLSEEELGTLLAAGDSPNRDGDSR